jgi:hypothetical protein
LEGGPRPSPTLWCSTVLLRIEACPLPAAKPLSCMPQVCTATQSPDPPHGDMSEVLCDMSELEIIDSPSRSDALKLKPAHVYVSPFRAKEGKRTRKLLLHRLREVRVLDDRVQRLL